MLYQVKTHIVNLTYGYGYTKPASPYYIISDTSNKVKNYVPLNNNKFEKYNLFDTVYVCSEIDLFSKLKQMNPCEMKLIFSIQVNVESCDVRITKTQKTFWNKSLDSYKIYISIKNEEQIRIKCKGISTYEKIMKGYSVTKLSENCQIESDDFTYASPKLRTFTSSEPIYPLYNFNLVKKLLHIVDFDKHTNVSELKDEFLFMETLDSDLGISSAKLDDIIQRAGELNVLKPS